MILPLRGFGELKGEGGISTPQDLIDKVLDMNMTGIKDIDDAIFHVLRRCNISIKWLWRDNIQWSKEHGKKRGWNTDTESVLKGPREGFNELIVDNVALIRRRLKNPDLKFEAVYVGEKFRQL